MTAACQTIALPANPACDKGVGESRQGSRSISAVLRVAHSLWGGKSLKLPIQLATCASVDQRTAERWLSRRAGLSADSLASLLRSDQGLSFLEGLMGEARPQWWADFKLQSERAAIVRRQKELRQQIARLEEAGG